MRAQLVHRILLGLALGAMMLTGGGRAGAAPAISDPVGHWRGVWMSTEDPRLFGPVELEIISMRGLRVTGLLEWRDASGMMTTFEVRGTTSAGCIFTYRATGTGATEGTDLLLHGMHEPFTAMGTYRLLSPGNEDEGRLFLVKNYDAADAPSLVGDWTGTYNGLLAEGRLNLMVETQEAGNFEGMVQVENNLLPDFGKMLEFGFSGRIGGDRMGAFVGVGPTGIFMGEGMLEPGDQTRMPPTFDGTYHVFYANGLEGRGMFRIVMMPDVVGELGPP